MTISKMPQRHAMPPTPPIPQTPLAESACSGESGKRTVFIPFCEYLMDARGTSMGALVPFKLDYECVRLLDGTYDFTRPAT